MAVKEEMEFEGEVVSPADMAEDAGQRARKLILALYGYGDKLDIDALANAVADGARRGATAHELPVLHRAAADIFAAAAASGAVASTLDLMAKHLSKSNGSPTVVPFAKATSLGNSSLRRHIILAFSIVVAIVSVFIGASKAFQHAI